MMQYVLQDMGMI